MKIIILTTLSFTLLFCSPKGPVTFKSSFVGGTKAELVFSKGVAKTVKYFDQVETYIYSDREDYYGKNVQFDENVPILPKYTTITEHIYYINEKGIVYKYQVWKKKTKPN
jgi:outer membrane protease